MANKTMKTLTVGANTYEIVDEKARTKVQNNTAIAYLTGTTNDENGNESEVFDSNVYVTEKEGQLHTNSLEIGNGGILSFDSDKQAIVISFKN